MDPSSFSPTSSAPGNQTPLSPMSPSPITLWSPHYLSRSNKDVGFSFDHQIPQGAVEPTYVWNKLTVDGDGPSFQPEGGEFVPGSVIFPEDFMSGVSQQDCEQLLHWHDLVWNQHAAYKKHHQELLIQLQDMERGMRRLEAHPKDWVRFEFDKFGCMSVSLRAYCENHDSGRCYLESDSPKTIGSDADVDLDEEK